MADQYYILEDGEQSGPFSLDELIDAAPDIHTRVLSTRENSWQDACDLPDLYDYFRGMGVHFPTESNLASPLVRLGAFIIDFILAAIIWEFIVIFLSSRGVLPGIET